MFHDAVLKKVTIDEDRALRILLEKPPGQTGHLELCVVRYQAVLVSGVLERDWFLSDCVFLGPFFASLDVKPGGLYKVLRVIILGTDGASIEVLGGELSLTEFSA